MITWP